MSTLGILAALGTAVCWAGTALCFASAGRRVGSDVVNLVRLVIAVVALTAAVMLLAPPRPTSSAQWGWLALSGGIGLALGDACYFQSLVLLGARRAALIMSFHPIPAALLDYFVFDERLEVTTLFGVALTLGGITWVVSERVSVSDNTPQITAKGLGFAVAGALCQAVGLAMAKLAMNPMQMELASQPGADPVTQSFGIALSVTQIRLVVAAGLMLVWMLRTADLRQRSVAATRDGSVLGVIALGALLGPILGVGLSNVSILHAPMGVASTLMATSPVMVIPMVMLLERERVSRRAFFGAVVAVAGVAVLAL